MIERFPPYGQDGLLKGRQRRGCNELPQYLLADLIASAHFTQPVSQEALAWDHYEQLLRLDRTREL